MNRPDGDRSRCSRASAKRDLPARDEEATLEANTSNSDRPPRLARIFQKYDPPIFFVTFCTYQRRRVLHSDAMHGAFRQFAERGYSERGIAVGRYVIMPDHIHLFVRGGLNFVLPQWTRMLKQVLGKVLPVAMHQPELWQRGFFDHLIRNAESYDQKWVYVRDNPVRAGLVALVEEWPWQGEIVPIDQV